MFATNLFGRLAKLYKYPCSKVAFLLPFNCKYTMRSVSSKKAPCISYGRRPQPRTKTALPSQQQNYNTNPSKATNGVKVMRKPFVPRNFATEFAAPNAKVNTNIGTAKKTLPQQMSSFEGLREFFSHPLTWERNNGYFNLLLGLAIFGYSFCYTCSGEPGSSSRVSYEEKGK